MNPRHTPPVPLLCLLGASLAAAQDVPAPGAAADGLFAAGRFAEASEAFAARWAADSTDYQAAVGLGTIALYRNRLDDAQRWLERAITLRPAEARPKALRSDWVTVDSLSMGDVTVRDVRASVGATLPFRDSFGFDAGGIISHQFFRRHALTFEFHGMRLYIDAP